MKRIIAIIIACASMLYGQSNVPITFTTVDGINYANVSLSQVDGIWYAIVDPPIVIDVVTNGLTTWWKMQGNANDSIGANNLSVFGATLTNGVDGTPDTAYAFTSTQRLALLDTSFWTLGTNDWSVSAWVYSGTNVNNVYIYAHKGTPAGFGFQLYTYTSNLWSAFSSANGSWDIASAVGDKISSNTWYHFVQSKTNRSVISYINGVSVHTGLLANTTTYTVNTSPFWVGNYYDGGIYPTPRVSHMRLYNGYGITAEEVATIYNAEKPPTIYANSLHEINISLWSNTVFELLCDTNNLSWTNNYNTSDTSYIGTNHITSYTGANAYDPAWRASTNTATYGTNGWWEFDGSDDYLTRANIPQMNSASQFVMMGWCRRSTVYDWQAVVGMYTDGDNRVSIGCSGASAGGDTSVLCLIGKTGAVGYGYSASGIITNGAINHLAMVFDGTQSAQADRTKLYVNGMLTPLTFPANISTNTSANLGVVNIGIDAITSAKWVGQLDDIRIIAGKVATSNEIFTIYNSSTNTHTHKNPW